MARPSGREDWEKTERKRNAGLTPPAGQLKKMEVRNHMVVEKSDAMKTHEKWIEETMRQKPKKKDPEIGELPIKAWHAFAVLAAFVLLFLLMAILMRL